MCTDIIAIVDIRFHHTTKMVFAEDNDVIETFPPE